KPRWRWAIEKSVLHKLRFPHDFVAPFSLCCEGGSPFFPPLRRGGRGGGYGTTSHTRFPRSLLLSPFASLSRGEKNWSRPSRIPHHPPYPPFARGGKGIACDVVSARAPKTRGSKPSLQLGEHPLYITRQWRLRFSDSASLRSSGKEPLADGRAARAWPSPGRWRSSGMRPFREPRSDARVLS